MKISFNRIYKVIHAIHINAKIKINFPNLEIMLIISEKYMLISLYIISKNIKKYSENVYKNFSYFQTRSIIDAKSLKINFHDFLGI